MSKKEFPVLLMGICVSLICIIMIVAVVFVFMGNKTDNSPLSDISSYTSDLFDKSEVSFFEGSAVISDALTNSSLEPLVNGELNADFSKLILVNANNPLPEDYDYEGNLTTIDKKYLCGYRNRIDKDVYIFAKEMLEAAWKDNVELYILSPYRSYSAQSELFQNKVKTFMNGSITREEAEIKASSVVAGPGTSEHHTGLAFDFNSVEIDFEETEMFAWLKEHGEEYGFIMRYAEDKQDLTGVIYEPWHWRFVGIKHAKEINRLGMCLEEYIEYLKS